MTYEYTHVQNHTCHVIIKKQIFGLNEMMNQVFGEDRKAFQKYVQTEFAEHEKNILGHDCYFILHDCINDEDPFHKYIDEHMLPVLDDDDEEYETEYDKAADKLEGQLAELEHNGLVSVGF